MGLRIATNMPAMSARRVLHRTGRMQEKAYQRLASGDRITRAGDDAAGLSISENFRAQIRSTAQAERNANDGISLVQVAEGGLAEIGNIMIRMRELSIQAATDTVGDRERRFVDQEVQSLKAEVNRIAAVTQFNGTPLLNGAADKESLDFQVGINDQQTDRLQFDVNANKVTTDDLEVSDVDTLTLDTARESLSKLDMALAKVSETRAGLGAMQNKLQSTVNNLQVSKENLARARSVIADTDIAEETSNLVRENILQGAGVSVLSQANSAPLQALKLL